MSGKPDCLVETCKKLLSIASDTDFSISCTTHFSSQHVEIESLVENESKTILLSDMSVTS